MSEVHQIILNLLSKGHLMEILMDGDRHQEFANADGLIYSDNLRKPHNAEAIADCLSGLNSVQTLRAKAEKQETITLGEFEGCLDQIRHLKEPICNQGWGPEWTPYVVWTLDRESTEIKSLLRAQSKDPIKLGGRS